MTSFDGFKKTGLDSDIEAMYASHMEKYDISPLDAVKHFTVLSRRQMLKRFLAHNELFLKTLDIPGDIAELGVFRGMGLFTWANFLESYCIGDRTKMVFGFDNWKGFTSFETEDGEVKASAGKVIGGFNPEKYYEELKSAIEIFDTDRFIPWKDRIKLIDGQIENTVPKFLDENPGVRFSLVHFDCDLYRPTKAALEAIWPKVTRGGLIIFDEYSMHDWPGETQAVDEFLKDKPDAKLKTLSWTNTPGAYLIKP